ncbi:MAG: Manganese transport system rane protein MntB [Verrucomicrobiota bacterium]|jgi:ABC-type Mn2+/Zn2+ transport system permease subunit
MNELTSHLLIPLQYDYMLRAIWVSALVGGVSGFLSSFVTLKGWSLMGDALSHAVVPGVVIAYISGLPVFFGAFLAGILATGAMALIRAQSRIREDATIGVVFTSFFALGLVLISLFPAGVDLKVILYGNILSIPRGDILQVLGIGFAVLLILGLRWRDLMLYCFDPLQARALGMNVIALHMMLLFALAAVSVAAMQAVGAILVLAMLIIPGATAYLLTDRFVSMLWISSGLGALTSLSGAYLSFFVDGATGGCIVSLQALVFVLVFIFAPKQGILAAKRKEVSR